MTLDNAIKSIFLFATNRITYRDVNLYEMMQKLIEETIKKAETQC